VQCKDLGDGWWSFNPALFDDGTRIVFACVDEFENYMETPVKILSGDRTYFWDEFDEIYWYESDGGEAPGYTYDEAVAMWGYAPQS
jgi:hypothetical protein